MILEPEPVEQALLHHEALAHHGQILHGECLPGESRSGAVHEEFFNGIRH
jgi:hypothetical protein